MNNQDLINFLTNLMYLDNDNHVTEEEREEHNNNLQVVIDILNSK